jgi:hypothetical protein
MREFSKGGANVHVKAHYRILNGKMVYVHDHDKLGAPVGHEAQIHERVQQSKSAKGTHTLMAVDPEDRDAVLKHAGQMGLKPEVKYQGGKIRDHEGNVKAHGFYYAHFQNEEDAKKVHASLAGKKEDEGSLTEEEHDKAFGDEGMAKDDEDQENDAAVEASSDKTVDAALNDVMDFVKANRDDLINASEGDEKDPEKLKSALAKMDELTAKLEKVVDLAPDGGTLAKTSQEAISKWLDRREVVQKKLGEHPSQQPSMDDGKGPEAPPELDENPNAQYLVGSHMNEADGHFAEGNHDKALESLKAAHALASKHGLKHVGPNGKEYDSDWMQKKINALEGAKPKNKNGTETSPQDGEYKTAADAATAASVDANQMTEKNVDNAKAGKHDENFEVGQKDHEAAMHLHEKAQEAHHQAFNKATTPELKDYHEKKSNEHAAKAKVHHQVAVKFHGKKKAAEAADAYAGASSKADMDTMDADHHLAHSEHSDHHQDAKVAHDRAAKSHQDAIIPAITHEGFAKPGVSGSDLANEHAAKATKHEHKAKFHEAAGKAWDATNKIPSDAEGHKAAAGLHEDAAMKAKKAGFTDAATKHEAHQKNHEKLANPESAETKHAYETSEDANDWSSHPMTDPQSHDKAAQAHKAAASAHTLAQNAAESDEMANKHHKYYGAHKDKQAYHQDASAAYKASDDTDKFHGLKSKHTADEHYDAAIAHTNAAIKHSQAMASADKNMSKAHVQSHQDKKAYHESMSAAHTQWHKEAKAEKAQDEADDAASSKPSPNAKEADAGDWKSHNLDEIHDKAYAAKKAGDHAEAAKYFKHAAIVAHHQGKPSLAQEYAKHAKHHAGEMGKGIQKAVDTKTLRMSVYEATRKIVQEKSEPRHLSKAIAKLPSAIRLQDACTAATKAGITGIEEIVNVAAGGKKQGSPIVSFLSDLKQ